MVGTRPVADMLDPYPILSNSITFGTQGGKSSSLSDNNGRTESCRPGECVASLPFWRLGAPGRGGSFLAVGWTGGWTASFRCSCATNAGGAVCSSDASCSVCAACCKDYLTGSDCSKCAAEQCNNGCGAGECSSCGSCSAATANQLRFTGGQKDFASMLLPREQIRTPTTVFMHYASNRSADAQSSSDHSLASRAHNLWRSLMIARFTPRVGSFDQPWGQRTIADMPLAASSGQFGGYNPAARMIAGIENISKHKLGLTHWWIDAGWWNTSTGLVNWFPSPAAPHCSVGDWDPDGPGAPGPDGQPIMPNGLAPVGAAAKANDIKLMLWFEPERVCEGTSLIRQHRNFTLSDPMNCRPPKVCNYWPGINLYNLADPAVLDFMVEKLASVIAKVGVDHYRQVRKTPRWTRISWANLSLF